MLGLPIEVSGPDSVVLRLHVQPGASRGGVAGFHGDALKVKVAAPAREGRANEATLALVAELLGVKPAQVSLASGASSRTKRVRVEAVDPDDVARRVAAATGGDRREQPGVAERSPSRQ